MVTVTAPTSFQEVGVQALPDGGGTGAHFSCKRREGNEEEEKEEVLGREQEMDEGEGWKG